MRSILTRGPGLLLSLAMAIAPQAAWAGPSVQPPSDPETTQRVNLGKTQSTTTEVRWQSTPKTTKETGPWQLVSSTTRVDKSQPTPTTVRLQEVRTDFYRQRTTTFPLEAKEQRTKTTTTQNYELRTYTEQSSSSTVMAPVTKEVGEWVTKMIAKPVTTPMQVTSSEPRLITIQVPVYRTVTSTYSIPSEPIFTPVSVAATRTETQTVESKRYKNELQTVREKYNGKGVSYCAKIWSNVTDQIKVNDDGTLTYSSSVYFTTLNGGKPLVFKTEHPGPEDSRTMWQGEFLNKRGYGCSVRITVKDKGDHDLLVLQGGDSDKMSDFVSEADVTLDAHLYRKAITAQVPYTVTETKTVEVPYTATGSLQLESLVATPLDWQGKPTTLGVYWRHHHGPGIKCDYRPVEGDAESKAAQSSKVVGRVAERLTILDPAVQQGYTLVAHHTDVMPSFLDDATPASIGTKSEQIFDHNEAQEVWDSTPHLVTKQIPVQKVIGWTSKTPTYRYSHLHDATVQCDNKYWVSSRGDSVTHSREPILAPVTESVTITEWATHSVIVQEPQTVTSTISVLVSAIPGEDISVSYSPWAVTGETRPVGEGTFQDATKKVDVPGQALIKDLTLTVNEPIEPIKSQSSTYTSDLSTGTKKLTITGLALRRQMKANEAIASQARRNQGGGSIPQDVIAPRGNGLGQMTERSNKDGTTGNRPANQSESAKKDGQFDDPAKSKDRVKAGK